MTHPKCDATRAADGAARPFHGLKALHLPYADQPLPCNARLIREARGLGSHRHLRAVLAEIPNNPEPGAWMPVAWTHNMMRGGYTGGCYANEAEAGYVRKVRQYGGAR